jgi:predicted dehydrogenase
MSKLSVWILWTWAVAHRWYLKWLCWDKEYYNIDILCDLREEIVKKTAEEFWVKKYCTSIEELLEENLDLVVVLTRHEDHFNHIKSILEKWINVYSEKPFAENFEDGLELCSLAKSKSLVFASAPQVMFSSRNQTVKKLIENRVIGKVSYIRASWSNMWPAWRKDTNYDPEWFYNNWGSLKSLWIYTLSALIWIMWQPLRISSLMGTVFQEREVKYGPVAWKKFSVTAYDNVTALIDFWDSCFATFDGSYSVANPSQNEFEIHWELWSLYVSGFGWKESIIFKNLDGKTTSLWPEDDCHINWNLSWWVEDSIMAIIEKRTPLASSDFALQIIKMMEKMEESSKNNTIVKF